MKSKCSAHQSLYCMKTDECRKETRDPEEKQVEIITEPDGQTAMVLAGK